MWYYYVLRRSADCVHKVLKQMSVCVCICMKIMVCASLEGSNFLFRKWMNNYNLIFTSVNQWINKKGAINLQILWLPQIQLLIWNLFVHHKLKFSIWMEMIQNWIFQLTKMHTVINVSDQLCRWQRGWVYCLNKQFCDC